MAYLKKYRTKKSKTVRWRAIDAYGLHGKTFASKEDAAEEVRRRNGPEYSKWLRSQPDFLAARKKSSAYSKARYDADVDFADRKRSNNRKSSRIRSEARGSCPQKPCDHTDMRDMALFRRWKAASLHGICPAEYDALEANWSCCICGFGFGRPILDHCHKTGKFRGVLCSRCNVGIGLLEDDVDIMRNAVAYLRSR